MSEEQPDSGGAVERTIEALVDTHLSFTHYDFVLAMIPFAFVLSLFVDVLLAVPTQLALVVASALGLLAVVDALFVNPPT